MGMRNEFTAVVEQDGPWYIAYCAEVPGANGQGATREECIENLREAIALILEHRREESLRCLPPEAEQELVVVG
jgi:predicted RNase H-like HicB family nuclease